MFDEISNCHLESSSKVFPFVDIPNTATMLMDTRVRTPDRVSTHDAPAVSMRIPKMIGNMDIPILPMPVPEAKAEALARVGNSS